jgi:hypothetical protein
MLYFTLKVNILLQHLLYLIFLLFLLLLYLLVAPIIIILSFFQAIEYRTQSLNYSLNLYIIKKI